MGACLASGCRGWFQDTTLEGPPRGAVKTEAPAPALSTVVLPVRISINALRRQLNASLTDPLYEEKGRSVTIGVAADLQVRKKGAVRVLPRGDRLRFDIPVRVRAEAYVPRRNGDRGAALGRGGAGLDIRATVKPTLTRDWKLNTETNLDFQWTDRPTIKIGGFNVDLSAQVDGPLRAQLPVMAKEIDRSMAHSTMLREQIEAVWDMLSSPQKVSASPLVVVRFVPRQLFATAPTISGRGVELDVGAVGSVAVDIGERMPRRGFGERDGGRLPPRQDPPDDRITRLAVPLQLSWQGATREARSQLNGMSYDVDLPGGAGRATAELSRIIDVYPSGRRVAIGAAVQVNTPAGAVQGTVWLLAEPTLDAERQVVRLKNVDFASKTSSGALNVSLNTTYERLRGRLEEQLVFPLKDQMDDLRKTMNTTLTEYDMGDGVILNGEFDSLALSGVRLADPHLIVDAVMEGTLSVKMVE
ncbi:MAG: DUF4403 family protein [Myxococcota bacterium]